MCCFSGKKRATALAPPSATLLPLAEDQDSLAVGAWGLPLAIPGSSGSEASNPLRQHARTAIVAAEDEQHRGLGLCRAMKHALVPVRHQRAEPHATRGTS